MRYTPILDISLNKALYKNINVRLVYLHMALKSGYHDADRDMLEISIRNLSYEVGISISATRHALELLERAKIISKSDGIWHVKKWLSDQKITSRQKQEQQDKAKANERQHLEAQNARNQEYARQEEYHAALRAQGKTSFMVYYEDLIQKAQNGDLDAQKLVIRHKAMYEQQKASISQK